METFNNLKMIENDTKGIYLVNFEKHQSLEKMERIKEQNRLRKQRERERKLLVSRNVTQDVTQCHATDIDKDKDKDIEEEKEREDIVDKPQKQTRHKYGLYNNVLLAYSDLDKLKAEFPDWEQRIERLSEYIASTGKSYKNHLATIRAWARKDNQARTVGANGIAITSGKSDLDGVF